VQEIHMSALVPSTSAILVQKGRKQGGGTLWIPDMG